MRPRQMDQPPTWTNWARTVSCTPASYAMPKDADEVRDLVLANAQQGTRVRVVGAGHSFTAAVATDGVLVSLDALDTLEEVRPLPDGGALVTVGAGIRLHALNVALAARGLAMANLGDIDRQSLAGALSTGTHGTGAGFTGLAAQVVGARVLTASGDIVETGPEHHGDLFHAARLGLGAVGILLAVTLHAVPAFLLTAREEPRPLDEVLEALTGTGNVVDANDHFELFWFPHTRRTLTKANHRSAVGSADDALASASSRSARARRWVDDELLSNGLFRLTNDLATLAPPLTRHINELAARTLAPRTYTAPSHDVLVSPRRVRFREMEYAVPRDTVVDVLVEIDRWIEASGEQVAFPLEVRFAAPDDVWLSTAHAQESAYIAVHQYLRRPHARYFAGVEQILRAAGGRPHWGKLHTLGHDELSSLYPRWDDFLSTRASYDPAGTFANAYTDRLFGPR